MFEILTLLSETHPQADAYSSWSSDFWPQAAARKVAWAWLVSQERLQVDLLVSRIRTLY